MLGRSYLLCGLRGISALLDNGVYPLSFGGVEPGFNLLIWLN